MQIHNPAVPGPMDVSLTYWDTRKGMFVKELFNTWHEADARACDLIIDGITVTVIRVYRGNRGGNSGKAVRADE